MSYPTKNNTAVFIKRAVERIAPLVQAYGDMYEAGDEATETVLVDMLTDLRHYADATQIDWDHADATTAMHHHAEVKGDC